MDIKEKVEEVVNKIKSDKNIKENFKKDPVKTVEDILGVDLPDGIIEKVADAVKANLTAETLDDVKDKLGGLFGKK